MSAKPLIKTCLYLDGFNFYYGELKNTPYKWINPMLFAERLFPRNEIISITEEKGSDVNLASHLLLDAFRNRFDAAIVISGDSDLLTPIRMVRDQMGKAVGVINPQLSSGPYKRANKRGSAGLKQAASFYRGELSNSQVSGSVFPNTLTDAQGAFHKPATW